MSRVLVVGRDGGELIQLGPVQIRILEDGSTTGHRLGPGAQERWRSRPGPPRAGSPGVDNFRHRLRRQLDAGPHLR